MALAVDATAHGHQDSAGTVSATITTTGPSLVLAFIMSGGSTSISGGGLTWNFLVQGGTSTGKIDLWYAESSGALVAQTITADPQDGYINLDLVSITGYDTGNLFDDNGTNPEVSTDGGDLVISTDFADTIIVASFGMSDTAAPSTTSGFTVDSSAHFQLTEHKIVTATQSSLTFGPGSGNDHGGACVAVRASSDSPAPATKIQFRAAGAQAAANSSPQSPALPTGHAAGDVLLLFCSQASAAAVTFTPPAGWTSIARNSDATRAMTIEVFAKIDNGSESAPSVQTSAATAGWTCQIGAWYNVDDGFIEDAAEVSSNAAAAATFQPTGITTVTANAWVLSYVCSKDDNALNYNNQNGYSDRMSGANYDTTLGNGSDQAIGVADKEFAAAGAQTCPTWNQSTNGNDAWVGLTLALRPKTLVWGARPDGYLGHSLMMQLLAT